jgi:hypothetical protein
MAVLNIKKLCAPSQLVLMITLASFAMQVLSTKGFFTQHNILVILSVLLGDLTLSVLLDVFCKSGHEQFAWALVSVSILLMLGADRLLQKPMKKQSPVASLAKPAYGQPRPMAYEAMRKKNEMMRKRQQMAHKNGMHHKEHMAEKMPPMGAGSTSGLAGAALA